MTITLPNYNTDGVELYSNSSCHFTANGDNSIVNLTVQGSVIPQDQQCTVILHNIFNPQSARTIDNATISVPVARDGISLEPFTFFEFTSDNLEIIPLEVLRNTSLEFTSQLKI